MALTVAEGSSTPGGPQPGWSPAALGAGDDLDGLLVGGRPKAAELEPALDDGRRVALLVSGRPPAPLEKAVPPIRLMRRGRLLLASIRLRLRLAAAERRMRRLAPIRTRLMIGDGGDGYSLGVDDRARIAWPVEAVLVLSRRQVPTALEQAIEEATRALGEPLRLRRCRVLAGGTLMAELETAAGPSWLLRIQRQPAAAAAAAPLELLLSAAPAESVRERLVLPAAAGCVGELGWSTERRVDGIHPRWIGESEWRECADFLTLLASTPTPQRQDAAALPSPASDARLLEPFLDERGRRRIARLAAETERRLADLPRRWGHGDFHPGNLLFDQRKLIAVLDWDAASPVSLPGLDLLHLCATATPDLRRLAHGARCSGPLQSLVLGPEGAAWRAWMRGQEIEPDPATIEALVWAYWLGRLARDVRTFADRASRGAWLDLNLQRPLNAIGPRGADS